MLQDEKHSTCCKMESNQHIARWKVFNMLQDGKHSRCCKMKNIKHAAR